MRSPNPSHSTGSLLPNTQSTRTGSLNSGGNSANSVRIRSSLRRGGNLLVDLPIGGRLTLGFLIAALIATLAASLIGGLRAQSLTRQTDFYQKLLGVNTSLNIGLNFLQLMNTKTHDAVAIAVANTSAETLKNDQTNILKLTQRFDKVLDVYVSQDLLSLHPDQIALLNEANHGNQVLQQKVLTGSVLRPWEAYKAAQQQILTYIQAKDLIQAQSLLRIQAERTNADAQSALRSLIQFNQRLSQSVRDAAQVEEQQQLVTTLIGSFLAFLLIVLVGWLISGTLVRRLKHLRHVTRQIESGQLDARVTVVGRDEIADVSASVNAMLDAITGLVDETRRQRDALTNAAEHLFSDMRVVSAGDLRINAPVSNDPIGMLANAFNFTVGRFRRFVLRAQTTIEQVEVISRQEMEHAENFSLTLTNYANNRNFQPANNRVNQEKSASSGIEISDKELQQRLQDIRERLKKLGGNEGVGRHSRAVTALAEQITHALNKLGKALSNDTPGQSRMVTGNLVHMHVQELRTLESLLQRMTLDLQNVQHNTTKSMLDLESDLALLANSLRLTKQYSSDGINASNSAKEGQQELIRQGQNFAGDTTLLARRLAALAQELRAAVVSFQLDTAENGLNIEPLKNTPAQHPPLQMGQSGSRLLENGQKTVPQQTRNGGMPLRSGF